MQKKIPLVVLMSYYITRFYNIREVAKNILTRKKTRELALWTRSHKEWQTRVAKKENYVKKSVCATKTSFFSARPRFFCLCVRQQNASLWGKKNFLWCKKFFSFFLLNETITIIFDTNFLERKQKSVFFSWKFDDFVICRFRYITYSVICNLPRDDMCWYCIGVKKRYVSHFFPVIKFFITLSYILGPFFQCRVTEKYCVNILLVFLTRIINFVFILSWVTSTKCYSTGTQLACNKK